MVLLIGRGGIKLHLHRLQPHWHDMKRILRIGLPNAGESMINWAANFFLLNIVNRTVPVNVAAAAHTNAIRIESISYMAGFAIAVATTTMVGQSLGMKDPRRATRSAYLAYAIGGGFMTFIGLLFIFFSRYAARFCRATPPSATSPRSAFKSPAFASPASPRSSSSAGRCAGLATRFGS